MLQKAHQLRPKEDKEISEAGGADWEYEIRTVRGLLYMHTGLKADSEAGENRSTAEVR